jgi:hypothetical protein
MNKIPSEPSLSCENVRVCRWMWTWRVCSETWLDVILIIFVTNYVRMLWYLALTTQDASEMLQQTSQQR